MANLEKLMIYLTPELRLCFLFDQASSLQDSELSKEVLLEEVLCKSLFPHLPNKGTLPVTNVDPNYLIPTFKRRPR